MFAQEEKLILPKIRDDLKLLETSVAEDGSKRWLLFDPVQNKYFNIAIDAFDLISNYQIIIYQKIHRSLKRFCIYFIIFLL